MYKRNEAVVCADGFRMSVQAHDGAYCEPRADLTDRENIHWWRLAFPPRRKPVDYAVVLRMIGSQPIRFMVTFLSMLLQMLL